MKLIRWFSFALAAAALVVPAALAAPARDGKAEGSFGALRALDSADAKKQAAAWLKSVKADAATLARFETIWSTADSVQEKVTATLILGDAQAAKLLADARNEDTAAPTEVPALLKDAKKPAFYRANLALAYGKALTLKKVYEEGLEALLAVKADDVADPSSYYFHKAVCEHALMLKDKADQSIDRLLVSVSDAPERYRQVASLMHYDMLTWREKDLGWIARKMESIQRRLDLQRGGKHTQRMQKEVLVRLDELIKELENQQKGGGGSGDDNQGKCPPGPPKDGPSGPNNNPNPNRWQEDTHGGDAKGPGEVDTKRVKEIAEIWGKLPPKEREKVMQELRKRLPAKDRAIMDAYVAEMKKRASK